MKKLLTFGLLLIVFRIQPAHAQYEDIALNFSKTYSGGTARFLSMAGAQTALGADLSCLTSNPAGLAFYTKSDISFSPSLRFSGSDNSFLDNRMIGTKQNFNIANAAFVFGTPDLGENFGWQNFAFSLGFNRINNFHNRIKFSGYNKNSSITDFFEEEANGTYYEDLNFNADNLYLYPNMAFYTYAIDTVSEVDAKPGTFGYSYLGAASGGKISQSSTVEYEGGQDEWAFGFASNYNKKFYIGASLGLVSARYRESSAFVEEDDSSKIADFKKFTLNETRDINGTGTNFRMGVIFRPVDWLRFGGSIQTPTFFTLNEKSDRSMKTELDNQQVEISKGQAYDFDLTTPYKYSIGLAVVMSTHALLTFDYEGIDYREANLGADKLDIDFIKNNNNITNVYTQGNNIRAGGEIRYGQYRFRAGYGLSSDPYSYKTGVNIDRGSSSITGGFGIKQEGFYFDIAVINTKYKSKYAPYSLLNDSQPVTTSSYNINTFVFTFGATF
ncbi:MAG: hypothetical protein A3H98_14160 [Bacteroidetes bacterium RIFCSPLOWO2_02_FULL_36_8]|nr:MAG: hypothetical protein A3H98_14160 [Bacteroidetes bacterium RIFCSPLOWO2_02_FULL_36_8]OFY68728.1 MAG: hypothetical protein A3G23_02735 [Bacteroidetes bacterium RIFCSPLOWO2_12_FULL_37_12]